MLALVSIKPDSCSLPPLSSSFAVIPWSRAVIEPPALVGVPPVPPALPIATTACPTEAPPGRLGRLQVGSTLEFDEGYVMGLVVTEHRRRVGLPVADIGDADFGRPVDDVVVGKDQTVEVRTMPVPAPERPGS